MLKIDTSFDEWDWLQLANMATQRQGEAFRANDERLAARASRVARQCLFMATGVREMREAEVKAWGRGKRV